MSMISITSPGGGSSFDPAAPGPIGGTTPNTGAFTAVAITQGTLTNPATGLSLSATWNDINDTHRGVDITITDTNSAAGSTPFRVRGGAAGTTELAALAKDGTMRAVNFGADDFSTVFVRASFIRASGLVATPLMVVGNGGNFVYFNSTASGVLRLNGQDDANPFNTLQLSNDHATTATAQRIQAHGVTTGTGASLTLAGGTGSAGKGNVVLDGGNRAAYDASPSTTTIRDILISHGLMAAS